MAFFDPPLGNLPSPPRPRGVLGQGATLVAQVVETRRVTTARHRGQTLVLPELPLGRGIFRC